MSAVAQHSLTSLATNPWLPQLARVAAIKLETPSIATYDLTLDDVSFAAAYRFAPGQFNMLYLPGIGESAISISSAPHRSQMISHTVRTVGNVTRALARLKPGDPLALRGPFGSAWPLEQSRGCDLVIACGGLGLPPLRPAIYHILRHRGDFGRVYLLYGARTPADLLFTSEYDAWRAGGIDVLATVDLGVAAWRGRIGVVPALAQGLSLTPASTRVFTCGPEIMMRFVVFEALARGIAAEHVFLSLERNMNCAVGLCGHCQLGPAFICKDGPVFSYQRIEPYLHVEDL